MITTIEQLKAIIPTVVANKIDSYLPYLNQAEAWVRSSILGPVYDQLADHERLQQTVDRAIAFRAYRDAIPGLDVLNNGNGFLVVADEHYQPASRDRVRALIDSMEQLLERTLSDLYEIIEDTSTLAEAYRPFVYGSIVERSLLPTLRSFNQYRKFDGGYSRWIDEKPRHTEIRLVSFDPRFGRELMERVIADPMAEENKTLVDPLRLAFAAAFMGDAPMCRAMCDQVERELRAHPEQYPEFKPVENTPFQSKSVLSTI